MELKANLRYFASREPTVYGDHIPPPRIRFFLILSNTIVIKNPFDYSNGIFEILRQFL
jgi:hypothetical protein